MAIHYDNGIGQLYIKEGKRPIAQIKYKLIETDPTKYTKKKWWGEFSTSREIKEIRDTITFRIEFENGRDGDCVVWADTESKKGRSSQQQYSYHFNGRGKLGHDFSMER
jgi:hypothetical protein